MKKKTFHRNQAGFSLMELLIVVAILGIVAAISIIGYHAVRRGASEKVAVARLHALAEAQQQYRVTFGRRRFGTLDELRAAQTSSGPLLNPRLAPVNGRGQAEAVDGWMIQETDNPNPETLTSSFGFELMPVSGEVSNKIYCIYEDGAIRSIDRPADTPSGIPKGGVGGGSTLPGPISGPALCTRSSPVVK